MDKTMSVLGKRTSTVGKTMEAGTAAGGNTGRRPPSEALDAALAGDLEEEKEHAQRWHLGLKPQDDAHHLRSWKVWAAPYQYGLRKSATECWAGSYRRRKRESMLN